MEMISTVEPIKALFTKEELHDAVLNLTLLHLRQAHLFSTTPDSYETVWALIGKTTTTQSKTLWNPGSEPSNFDMGYGDIATCLFAQVMDQMYDFAYNGTQSIYRPDPMEYESLHTWVAAILIDLDNSRWVDEWVSYGASIESHVTTCLNVCEMANARAVLEGHGFSYMNRSRNAEADDGDLDSLTIRQMALLANVEEISVRAAIRREGPNRLVAHKDERRTLIARDVAKTWLVAKGKYMAITKIGKRAIDLTTDEFTTLVQLKDALVQHANSLGLCDDEIAKINTFDGGSIRKQATTKRLANVLKLDPELLVLRFDEADALERLAAARSSLREIKVATKTVRNRS